MFMTMNPGNGDQSIPDRDSSRRNNSSDSNKSDDSASQKPHHANTDWREFRAMLYNNYQVMFFFPELLTWCFANDRVINSFGQ